MTSTHSPSLQKMKPYIPTFSSRYILILVEIRRGHMMSFRTATHSFFMSSGFVATATIALRNQQFPKAPKEPIFSLYIQQTLIQNKPCSMSEASGSFGALRNQCEIPLTFW